MQFAILNDIIIAICECMAIVFCFVSNTVCLIFCFWVYGVRVCNRLESLSNECDGFFNPTVAKNSLEIFRKKNYVHDSACDMDFYIKYIYFYSLSAFVSILKSFATNRGKKLTVNNKIKDEKKTYNRE